MHPVEQQNIELRALYQRAELWVMRTFYTLCKGSYAKVTDQPRIIFRLPPVVIDL
jgi:hypothetical protein